MASVVPTAVDVSNRVRQEFESARKRFLTESNNAQAAWQFGRACFDFADATSNKVEKAEMAERGIDACHRAVAIDPSSAPAHYYLGMNVGELADTRHNLGALHLVKDMERDFQKARDLDEHFDYGGPDRNLGLLYLEAPSIVSIGSRSKARQHLHRAIELASDYPENRLVLIEACLKWGDSNEARRQLRRLEELWPEARKKFSGDNWESSWRDWEIRLKAAQRKLGQDQKILESPHED